jgi:hypothetical protein
MYMVLQQIQRLEHEVVTRFWARLEGDYVVAGNYNEFAKCGKEKVRSLMKEHVLVVNTRNTKLAFRKEFGDWLLWVDGEDFIEEYTSDCPTASSAFDDHYLIQRVLAEYVADACNKKAVIVKVERNDPFYDFDEFRYDNPNYRRRKTSISEEYLLSALTKDEVATFQKKGQLPEGDKLREAASFVGINTEKTFCGRYTKSGTKILERPSDKLIAEKLIWTFSRLRPNKAQFRIDSNDNLWLGEVPASFTDLAVAVIDAYVAIK